MIYKPNDELVNEGLVNNIGFNEGDWTTNMMLGARFTTKTGRPLYNITQIQGDGDTESIKFNISARKYKGISYEFNCQNITELFKEDEDISKLPTNWRKYCINSNSVVPNTLYLTNAIHTTFIDSSKEQFKKFNTWLTHLTSILRNPTYILHTSYTTPSHTSQHSLHPTPTNQPKPSHIPEKQSHVSKYKYKYKSSNPKCECSKVNSNCTNPKSNNKFCLKCGMPISVSSTKGGSKKKKPSKTKSKKISKTKPKKLSKKKSPKLHTGPRGGKYIIKKGKKIYQ